QTVWTRKEKMTVGKKKGTFEVAYPDSLVGTDSHTTMVNGLAVLGWGVVGKFVEFFGPGLDFLSVADKATIGNMAPEYGATCGFFPVDAETIDYLKTSGRAPSRIALVSAYAKARGLFRSAKSPDPVFTETLTLDLADVVPSMAGPKRPEGRVALPAVAAGFSSAMTSEYKKAADASKRYPVENRN